MALKKLQIQVEASGAGGNTPVFKPGSTPEITALFNPNQLQFSKSVNWSQQDAKGRDTPELQFTNSNPRTLTLDLLFDTYDTARSDKDDVRTKYTDSILKLMLVDEKKHRPPVCRLIWGSASYFFQGVLQDLTQRFTMFMEDGTPVRATLSCTFREWWTNNDDLQKQALQSSDVAKRHTAKRGDSLASIAAEAYQDPTLWRPIAVANGIDDPRSLIPGTALAIPALPDRYLRRP